MLQLSTDESFHFETLRLIASAAYGGADVGECLVAAGELVPGDFESWYAAWLKRADTIVARIPQLQHDPVGLRDAYFRAATYCRAADFYLHGNWDDQRILELWDRQTEYFDKAMAMLPTPGRRMKVPSMDGSYQIPFLYFPAEKSSTPPRPTIVFFSGYDGSVEEMYYVHGTAALERGYNVAIFEGPGQPAVRRYQGIGFTHEYEKVVAPVLDYLATLPEVDMAKVALMGYSLSGLLCVRASAFEHRLAAVFAIDGVWSFADIPLLNQDLVTSVSGGNDFATAEKLFNNTALPTGLRWAVSHGLWAFKTRSPAEFFDKVKKFTLDAELVGKIQCPVFVGNAVDDMFFKGQPEVVAEALGDRATMVELTDEDGGAGAHCHLGAARLTNAVMWEWFEEKVVRK